MNYWTETEQGTLLGFIVGSIILVSSYFFSFGFNSLICLNLQKKICFRIFSFLPFLLALIGFMIGINIKKRRLRKTRKIQKQSKAQQI